MSPDYSNEQLNSRSTREPLPHGHAPTYIAAVLLACALLFNVRSYGVRPYAVAEAATSASLAVAPQFDTTHVYVPSEDFDRFVASFVATFGGTTTPQGIFTVTPTPSKTKSQLILTPAGTVSVFGFETPVPWPFGAERTGYLVTDIDDAVRAAKDNGADVLVSPFPDPIGKDAVIQWPGGVNMQLYWHTNAPTYPPLSTVPENRVYVSPIRANDLIRDFVGFSHGSIESDVPNAPGREIGRANTTYRRVRIVSTFGRMTIIVTEGFLPYPFGRELTGYEVSDLSSTLSKARSAGVSILVPPYVADRRIAAIVRFPGGYIAEIHSAER